MPETTAARLRTSLASIVEAAVELVGRIPIRHNDRANAGMFIMLIPEWSFGEVSADARARQVSIKRRYDQLAEVIRVLLGRAPDDLLRQWKNADEQFRRWIELQSQRDLEPHRASNERWLRADAGPIEKVLAVLEALGDKGVLLVPDTSSLIDQPDPMAYRAVAGRDDFAFILLPTVLGELDDLKRSHRAPEIREGAKKAVARYKGWRTQAQQHGRTLLDGITVDGTITVRAHHGEPDMAATLSWLDPTVPDDRIIAAVLTVEAEHPAAHVVLVTSDINMHNKADGALIETAETP